MSYRTISLCLLLAVFSCDYIDDPIQASIGPVDPCELPKMQFKGDSSFRKVLIEDFTGHRCNNCPLASDAIKAIEQNQAGAIVAVAMHAGPANFIDPDPPTYPTDFRTPEGDDLEEFFKVTFLPAGMVSRTDFSMTLDTAYVRTNCHLVAFVTNTATEEVLQVTEVDLSAL